MKQTVLLQLLQLLREETDENHRLSQQQIRDKMKERFGITLNRRTLKTYLDDLKAAGCPLNSTAIGRQTAEGDDVSIQTGWYLEPEFESSELRLLSDLLAAAPALPGTQRDSLLAKLRRYASPSFRERAAAASPVYLHRAANPQLLFSVELLCEAMHTDCMVQFRYCSYQADKQMHPQLVPRLNADGEPKIYTVSPYEIAVSHGQYYLLCCTEGHDNLSGYRIDRIEECRLLQERRRRPVSEIEGGVQLPQHLAEHLYMYTGAPVECKFLIRADRLGDVVDWFRSTAEIAPTEDPSQLLVTVQVHPTAMQHWALQYGRYVTVLEPQSLRESVTEAVRSLAERYGLPEQWEKA